MDWRASSPRSGFDLRRFAWVWCVVVFVFFSTSDSKLITYIMPLFPQLALLMATGPTPRLDKDLRATGIGMLGVGALLLVGAVLLPHFLHEPLRAPYFLQIRPPLVLMGLCSAAGGIAALKIRPDGLRPTLAVGLGGLATWTGVLWAAAVLAPVYSGATLYQQLPATLRQDVPVYSVRTYDQSLTFYLRHPVTLVEYRGELDFGQTLEPEKAIGSLSAFDSIWRDSTQALAVLERPTYRQLQTQGLPMVIRANSPRTLIVSRR